MSGGLKVGDLYVLLSAKTSAFGKSMESAAKLTEQVAKKIKKSAMEIGRVGAMMGAAIGAAMAIAAESNSRVANEVGRSKEVFNTFASEIATMMLPALQRMNTHLRELLGWWQALSPETKAHIAHWVEMATGIGLAALAIGKVAGLVSALAPAFGALGGVFALGLGPLLGIAAGLVAVIVGVALLHKHWATVWNAIAKIMHAVVSALGPIWTVFVGFVSDLWDGMVDKAALAAKAIVAIWLQVMQMTGKMDEQTAGLMRYGTFAAINVTADMAKSPAGLKAMALAAFDVVKGGALDIVSEWKEMIGELGDILKEKLGFTGKEGSTVSAAAATKTTAAQRLGEVGEQGNMAEYYKNATVESLSRSKKLGEDDEQGHTTAATAQAYADEIEERKKFTETMASFRSKLGSILGNVASKMGDLGSIISAGVSGFQSGGIWGAIIAVFMELLSRFKRFQELIDIGNGQIKMIVDQLSGAFGPIIDALRQFMGASGMMTQVIMQLLLPILKILGKVFGLIAQVVETVATTLEGLQPIFELVGAVLGVVIDVIGYVMRFVGVTIMGTMHGLLAIWIGILEIIKAVMSAMGAHDPALEKLLTDAKSKQNSLEHKMRDLWENGTTGLGAKSADAAEAVGKMADAADKATESLTNMPSGFKAAFAQFNATSATSSTGGGAPSFGAIQVENERQAFRATGNASSASYHRGKNKADSSDN